MEIKPELWEQIQQFSFDAIDADFPFSARLAKDNQWGPKYTLRVIEEYRKFIFLAMIAEHPVSPSKEIDEAWHLHLLYTKSYWQDLCQLTLKKDLHHHPTKGGQEETKKFESWYKKTCDLYCKVFATEPPQDIWTPPQSHVRPLKINPVENWVISKQSFTKVLCSLLLISTTVFITACSATVRQSLFDLFSGDKGTYILPIGIIVFVILFALHFKKQAPKRTKGTLIRTREKSEGIRNMEPRERYNDKNSGCGGGCGGCGA